MLCLRMKDIIAGTTDYGVTFTAMVWKDNVFAMQFHPEKSQELGLKILKGYGDFVKKSVATGSSQSYQPSHLETQSVFLLPVPARLCHK